MPDSSLNTLLHSDWAKSDILVSRLKNLGLRSSDQLTVDEICGIATGIASTESSSKINTVRLSVLLCKFLLKFGYTNSDSNLSSDTLRNRLRDIPWLPLEPRPQ